MKEKQKFEAALKKARSHIEFDFNSNIKQGEIIYKDNNIQLIWVGWKLGREAK